MEEVTELKHRNIRASTCIVSVVN